MNEIDRKASSEIEFTIEKLAYVPPHVIKPSDQDVPKSGWGAIDDAGLGGAES